VAAPITSPSHVYGWLCLVGNDGRGFTEDDEQLLLALSGQVGRIYENGYFYRIARHRADVLETEIEKRVEAESALRAAEERMRFALEAAGVGIWDMDVAAGTLQWSTILESQRALAGHLRRHVRGIHRPRAPARSRGARRDDGCGEPLRRRLCRTTSHAPP
jgi:hypothetical protein